MISVQEAETILLNLVQPLDANKDTEIVTLEQVSNRILAHNLVSKLDFPHWDNSAMDGYAVRYEDVKNCSAENPINLEIVEEIPAGYQPKITIEKGQAARIFTGAVMPEGADTIVMQENTKKEGKIVSILASVKYQEFVRHKRIFLSSWKQSFRSRNQN
jgi:molybdopterin molybdotransferase